MWIPPLTGAQAPPPPEAPQGKPWLVALTVGVAVIVLALVAVGLWLFAGQDPIGPAGRAPRARPTLPRSAGPATAVPGRPRGATTTSSIVGRWTVDTTSQRLRVSDAEGRFEVTMPPTWSAQPASEPDLRQWTPPVRLSNGNLLDIGFTFTVRWGPAAGCTAAICAERLVASLAAQHPDSGPTTRPGTIGGQEAVEVEASFGDERLLAWVVVKGERSWVVMLGGPKSDFEPMLALARSFVASMSFG